MPTTFDYLGDTDLLYVLNKFKNVLEGTGGFTPGYVKQVSGKGLSTEDFTAELLTKLNGITDSADAVSWTQTQSSTGGVKIAEITINGTTINVYAPEQVTPTVDTEMSSSSTNAVQNKVIKKYVDDAVGAVVTIHFEVVSLLPVTGDPTVIYLVPNGGSSGSDQKDEYVWIESESRYEKIGSTNVDLSGYVQASQLVEISTSDIDTMFDTVFGS